MMGHRKGHRQSGLVVGRFTGCWDIGRAIDRVDWWSVGLLGGGT